ncbi:bifunctional diaminohydroxyphosphoribosylaminopyrimidine deaminase/5-amino-6-(5-phosphoribosylamino)uracil reductase RibD [Hwanghaeella sp.]|uniref:bifunctional diaminohydroxyphosphoribosylaminopyrimidine deaminase/5-amino-6-(5-phosphoribosylamino)uracil reductase RibD n=1 Tax=Hwanghaeella sp. TaxID=2605943 RepID=UPI003CCB91DB
MATTDTTDPTVFSETDKRHMRTALALSRRGLGNVWPNPAVGSVVVGPDGMVVGRGWTQPGGRPHAEAIALERAGDAAQGGTLYVTLEPCNHYGKTPPCTEAIVAAGVARVVGTLEDPDPRVSGSGYDRLRQAGIKVDLGLMAEEARHANAGFFSRLRKGRPWVTLKMAISMDGRIALASGESQWITCAEARQIAHKLRAENDAILVGIGTVLADNPQLTCRLPGYEGRQPVRVVLDGKDRIPPGAAILSEDAPTWTDQDLGNGAGERPDPGAILAAMSDRGITRLLIEGGGTVAAAFIAADLVDEIICVSAPMVIGGDGIPVVGNTRAAELAGLHRFKRVSIEAVGCDSMVRYIRN